MTRKTVVALLLVALAAPLRAELKYTMHVEAHKTQSGEPANPMLALAGEMFVKMMVPIDGEDAVTIIGEKGVRLEHTKANALMPEGSIQLTKPDGSMFVLIPKDKTYWRFPKPEGPGFAELKTKVDTKRSGEFMTIVGLRAERVTVEMKLDVPLPPGLSPDPDFPSTITVTTESWVTDKYASYAALAAKGPMAIMSALHIDIPTDMGGFVLRSILRSPVLGGYEIESIVTKISEEPVAAGMFEIPSDYKEIPMPAPRIGGATK